jgi:hypothetical protein
MSEATAMKIPSFNLNADALDIKDDASLAAEIEKEGKRGFEAGNYTLKLTKPRFHANKVTGLVTCAKDATWFNVACTLESADGRSKDYFVQVPTSKVKYGAKGTLFVFKKYVEFMAAIGESVNLNNLSKVTQKYFSSEETLKRLEGKEVVVDVGYEGAHAEKEGESYKIVLNKKGDTLQLDGATVLLPDFASAKVYAESQDPSIKLEFAEIVKLHSAIKQASNEGWKD